MSNLLYSISDTHISNRKGFVKDVDNSEFPGTNSRFYEIIKAIRLCADQAVSAGAEALVIPGDVFNERGILPVAVYNASYKVFEDISKKIRLIFLPGNHDCVSSSALHSDAGLHSLYGFKEFADVAHSPETYETDSFSISMVPFIPNKEGTVAAAHMLYNKLKKSKKFNLVFFHHSFEGAETGPINFKMPYPLTYEDIPPFDGKFSGHIHKHQTIGKDLVYIGAPLHHDAGERNYNPGWLEINDRGSYRHIENTFSPRFVVTETSSLKDVAKLGDNNYKIVKWTGEEASGYKLKDSYDNIRVELTPKELKQVVRTSITSTDSVEDMMRKYMQSTLGHIDEDLLTYGLNVWRNNEV